MASMNKNKIMNSCSCILDSQKSKEQSVLVIASKRPFVYNEKSLLCTFPMLKILH